MTTARLLLSMSICALLLVACHQSDGDGSDTARIGIRFSASMDAPQPTRATSVDHLSADNLHFTAGQHIALFMTEANPSNGAEIAVTDANRGSISYDGTLHTLTTKSNDDISFDFSSECYWPATNHVNFYAWHPYSSTGCFVGQTSKSTPTFTVASDQRTPAAYAASDLMYARHLNIAKQTSAVNLNFKHALSRVIVTLTSSDGNITPAQLASATVTIDGTPAAPIYLGATVDIDGGTATKSATGETTQTLQLGTGATTFAILPPGQSLKGKKVTFALQDGGTQQYTIQSIDNLAAQHSYTITLSLTLNAITVSESVSDWTSGGDDRDESLHPLYI